MNDLFISEKNISLQKKSTTQVNVPCTLEIQLVQCLNLMTLSNEAPFYDDDDEVDALLLVFRSLIICCNAITIEMISFSLDTS